MTRRTDHALCTAAHHAAERIDAIGDHVAEVYAEIRAGRTSDPAYLVGAMRASHAATVLAANAAVEAVNELARRVAAAKRYRANLETPTNEERQVAEYHASAEGAAVAARVAVESIRALVEKAAAEYAPGGEDADPAHDEATEAARRGVA